MTKTSRLARGALIGALYAAMTLAIPGLGFGPLQLRLGEALSVLPFFMPEAVWGLTLGCFVSNIIGVGYGLTGPWDIIFGTAATFIAAVFTARIKKIALSPLPAVIVNAVVVGVMLTAMFFKGLPAAPLFYNIATVGIGQAAVCFGLGLPLAFLYRGYSESQKNTQTEEEDEN